MSDDPLLRFFIPMHFQQRCFMGTKFWYAWSVKQLIVTILRSNRNKKKNLWTALFLALVNCSDKDQESPNHHTIQWNNEFRFNIKSIFCKVFQIVITQSFKLETYTRFEILIFHFMHIGELHNFFPQSDKIKSHDILTWHRLIITICLSLSAIYRMIPCHLTVWFCLI